MLSHSFVAVIFQFLREGVHERLKLLVGLLGRVHSSKIISCSERWTCRHSLGFLWLLLLKFHLLTFLSVSLFGRLASKFAPICRISFRLVSCATDLATWFPFTACSVLILFGLLFFRLFYILLGSIRLHNVIYQIVYVFFVYLLISYRNIVL